MLTNYKESIFQRLENITKNGIKFTKENIDSYDPTLYSEAKALFGGWKETKKAFRIFFMGWVML